MPGKLGRSTLTIDTANLKWMFEQSVLAGNKKYHSARYEYQIVERDVIPTGYCSRGVQ